MRALIGREVCLYESMYSVNMVVTKAQNWKLFLVESSTSLLYLPIPLLAETRKVFRNMLCQFVFA